MTYKCTLLHGCIFCHLIHAESADYFQKNEEYIVSQGAGLKMEGLPTQSLWDLVINVFEHLASR